MTMLSRYPKPIDIVSGRTWRYCVVLGVVLCFVLVFGAVLAADALRPVHTYTLTPQVKTLVGEDGNLEVLSSELALPLLRGTMDTLADTRRRRGNPEPTQSLVSFSREGMAGGQRGFSSLADDDADGQADEDWLDGRDNDGDGLIDEDFAAISDAMTAISLTQGSGWAQLEFMQWAGTRLQNALFLNFAAAHELSGVMVPYYRLESGGEPWREMDVFSRRHNLAGQNVTEKATAFVLRQEMPNSGVDLTDPSSLDMSDQPNHTWLGVLVLDQSTTGRAKTFLRPQLAGGTLSLPLSDEPTAAVICVASSWMQLNRLLLDAVTVYEGVKDPVNQQNARWIVSPLCSRCRLEKEVDVAVVAPAEGPASLSFTLESGRSGLLDPDLFVVSGFRLGYPQNILWEPTEGTSLDVSWFQDDLFAGDQNLPNDLYGLLGGVSDHTASGKLIYQFDNFPAELFDILNTGVQVELAGVWLDGRKFVTQSAVNLGAGGVGDVSESGVDASDESEVEPFQMDSLSLSPKLLEGWPNPFHDQIRIEFTIPSSAHELFDWPEGEPIPEGVELAGPIVWSGGQPSVSVKVYSINGQELVALQQGNLGEGRYSVSWNGTDAFGRQVASGTYFCKLQLDDWSITRRLVFIR